MEDLRIRLLSTSVPDEAPGQSLVTYSKNRLRKRQRFTFGLLRPRSRETAHLATNRQNQNESPSKSICELLSPGERGFHSTYLNFLRELYDNYDQPR